MYIYNLKGEEKGGVIEFKMVIPPQNQRYDKSTSKLGLKCII